MVGVFPLALIALAIALGGVAGPVLDRAGWPAGHPATAIICWAGLLTGTVAAVSGLMVLVLLSPPGPAHGLLEWLDSCLPRHGHAGLAMASIISVALVSFCCSRFARGVPRLWRGVVHRRRHREMLKIVAREDENNHDVLILDHPLPVAYCLPARHRPIVVSSGAQARLNPPELAAVLAHERAHLRQRHHLLLLFLDLTCTLLPWLPTIRRARASLPPLLEMAADDAAARRCGRRALSAALRRLVILPGPAGVLAATGTPTGTSQGTQNDKRGQALARRLARLESTAPDSVTAARALAWISAAATVAGPLAAVAFALAAMPLPC